MVDELERHLPRMLREYHDDLGFWSWFAGEAASIGSRTCNKQDWLHVRDRLSAMLDRVDAENRDNRNE